jgi:hypothetical protein
MVKMVSGTIQYVEGDMDLALSQLSSSRQLPLWKSALVISVLGAIIGDGVFTLLNSALRSFQMDLSVSEAYGALGGAVLIVTFGAWHLSKKASSGIAHLRPQTFFVDEAGVSLSTSYAESRMLWPHFAEVRNNDEQIAMKTLDGTIVLLRPEFVANLEEWAEIRRLVAAGSPRDAD